MDDQQQRALELMRYYEERIAALEAENARLQAEVTRLRVVREVVLARDARYSGTYLDDDLHAQLRAALADGATEAVKR